MRSGLSESLPWDHIQPILVVIDLKQNFKRGPQVLVSSSLGEINFLLTEHEGRTGKYWPEVVAVLTERSVSSFKFVC